MADKRKRSTLLTAKIKKNIIFFKILFKNKFNRLFEYSIESQSAKYFVILVVMHIEHRLVTF